MESEPDLHLPNFLALRSRGRAAYPVLGPLSDVAYLTVLAKAVRGPAVAGEFALVRLMPGHPERGDGRPATEAERDAARWGKVPEDTARTGGPITRDYCGGMMPFTSMRGMAVPLLDRRRLRPAVNEAMALIDAFHRGGGH
jgi:hypothetical protein